MVPLGLTAVASGIDAAIQKNIFGSGMWAVIISIEEIEDIMNIVKSLDESSYLIKGVSKIIKNKAARLEWGCFGILLGLLAANILGNVLAKKTKIRAWGIKRTCDGVRDVISVHQDI